ncbi:DUF2268 domain-containing protein [Lentibacillus sediminis]|uniref:DUF2268 domain-containing protein n=1 Tax=Lentibacillus sediminis TaxID=1940529 RepID=UPI000C1BF011|nr:DUF2268 domain-containing protein [Lentibacillus sediminis]
MGVIRTDKWITEEQQPSSLAKKLESCFDGESAKDIFVFLQKHGMARLPFSDGEKLVEKLQEIKAWHLVQREKRELRQVWSGPEVPIFILPADTGNRRMMREFHGKSGVAFPDKLFLFLSENNTAGEIRALFTHEYNHVCRLSRMQQEDSGFSLLDRAVLEGMAEHAVRERFGDKFTAKWTSYYTEKQLERFWLKLMLPNRDLSPVERGYEKILYGLGMLPDMAGYAVGYFLVGNYMEKNQVAAADLLTVKTEEIANSFLQEE